MGSIAMHLFKCGSRNNMNQQRSEGRFLANYRRMFNLRMPHMDTINAVFKLLDEDELETLKQEMVKILIEKKAFHKLKIFGKYFSVAVDATGVFTFSEQVFVESTKKEYTSFFVKEEAYEALHTGLGARIRTLKGIVGRRYKKIDDINKEISDRLGEAFYKGHKEAIEKHITCKTKTKYFQNVLEAKLIFSNGFSISLATQWIENPASGKYDKQDCELKAFKRLAKNLKKVFPRLPICIVADGLYPNVTFFDICKNNGWKFICTYTDGSLKSIRSEIENLLPLNAENKATDRVHIGKKEIKRTYQWINDLEYEDHYLHWIRCVERSIDVDSMEESITNFEYLCSERIDQATTCEWVKIGRMRQNIEDSFNTQKNRGYKLQHKYSRSSLRATKNFYQSVQIAHLINQLCELSLQMKKRLKNWKGTLQYFWELLRGFMVLVDIQESVLETVIGRQTQFRYST